MHNDYTDGPIYDSCGDKSSYDPPPRSYVTERSRVPEQLQVHCPVCWLLNVVTPENNSGEYSGYAGV